MNQHVVLTEREEAMLKMLAEGLRNKDIARRLSLAEGTIKEYVHRLFLKTGCTSRLQLALLKPSSPSVSFSRGTISPVYEVRQ